MLLSAEKLRSLLPKSLRYVSLAHVHVVKAGRQAKVSLETEMPELLVVENMSRQTVKKALKLVLAYQIELLRKWREMHG